MRMKGIQSGKRSPGAPVTLVLAASHRSGCGKQNDLQANMGVPHQPARGLIGRLTSETN